MREVLLGLKLAWMAVTLVTMTTVAAPYILSARQIANVAPRCERKAATGRDCFMCGMTTGFIASAHGRFGEAEQANRAAVPLFGGFIANGMAVAWRSWRGRLRC